MSDITYPNGLHVSTVYGNRTDDTIVLNGKESIYYEIIRGSMGDSDFLIRCIRLANPPDPATRQIWAEPGGMRVLGMPSPYVHASTAHHAWHMIHGGGRP